MSITPTPDTNDLLWDDPDDLTDEEIAEIRIGIRHGLEAAAAGRIKPLAQVVAEARQRHGFPSSWASGIDGAHLHPATPVEQRHEAFGPDVLALAPAERGNKEL